MKKTLSGNLLMKIYSRLYERFGPQHWWPGETSFEVMVGAILTQNTSWKNVEKAIYNLRERGLLNPKKLHRTHNEIIANAIYPAGYYNIKTKRLRHFLNFLAGRYGANIQKMKNIKLPELRRELLGINGIGNETADSILLYAMNKPSFVIDAYTKRFLSRHGLVAQDIPYAELQKVFMYELPNSVRLFNEYHALIVRLGKDICKTKPICEKCPLCDILGPRRGR